MKQDNGTKTTHSIAVDSVSAGSDLRIRDEDGYVINENRCDSCDGDGYHVTEVGTDYICDHCKGSGLL